MIGADSANSSADRSGRTEISRSNASQAGHVIDQDAATLCLQARWLSEVERKMLYFSETAWTLPDIAEVNEAFDRECDQAEYEAKIRHLIRELRARDRKDNPEEFKAWTEAVRTLGREDYYLLALIE
jgi:hypothetical protein